MTARNSGRVMYPLLHDKQWLKERHHDEGWEYAEIAGLIGCSTAAARTALVKAGLYRPRRRPREVRVLAHITPERMVEDAKRSSSWWQLANRYAVQRIVVQDHAIYLGIFDDIPKHFHPDNRGSVKGLEPNELLQSKDWIVKVWSDRYQLKDVAYQAGVSMHTLAKWLTRHGMAPGEMRDARNQAIVIDYLDGQMLREVSAKYRIDPAGIFRILQKAGVDTSLRKKFGDSRR